MGMFEMLLHIGELGGRSVDGRSGKAQGLTYFGLPLMLPYRDSGKF